MMTVLYEQGFWVLSTTFGFKVLLLAGFRPGARPWPFHAILYLALAIFFLRRSLMGVGGDTISVVAMYTVEVTLIVSILDVVRVIRRRERMRRLGLVPVPSGNG